jgi:CRISPR-associated endonuclease Cas1
MESDEGLYHAVPQTMGKIAHRTVDEKTAKNDELNVMLDIGYTILFNYIECYLRMFGFDLYKGVFHSQWFKRKSLVCDIMEPFRCIIDRTIRSALNKKQFSLSDFVCQKGEFKLKYEECGKYYQTFFDTLIQYKSDTFLFIQSFYRNFMRGNDSKLYKTFDL